MPPGRTKNTVKSQPLRLAVNPVERAYLEAIANAGTQGNNWTEVAHRFIGDGIERAVRKGMIPRRAQEVPYDTAEKKAKG
jgi:hypothetical protein